MPSLGSSSGAERAAETQSAEDAGRDGERPSRAPHRGDTVGRYIVLERLGAGGMGIVFAAYDPELDRKVALKLLHPGRRRRTEIARARLRREAQALARLSHPSVITVHDVGSYEGQLFVAMEFVDGDDMAGWLEASKDPKPWREVLDVMVRAGEGLAAAHEAGVIHRDFKPENVLVGRDGRVRVVDFGLARTAADDSELDSHSKSFALAPGELAELGPLSPNQPNPPSSASGDEPSLSGPDPWGDTHGGDRKPPTGTASPRRLTEAGTIMGTPSYMAPEQHRGESTDARSDQFSFCVALYEALYGERPFAGTSFAELGFNVLEGNLREPPRARAAVVPSSIRKAITRGLSVQPAQRWPDMRALLAALTLEPQRRRRRWQVGLALATVTVVGAGALLWFDASRPTCRGAERKLEGVWDDAQRSAMAHAFGSSDLPYAEDVLRWTTAELDAYAQGFVAMHTEVCEATTIRKEQSHEMMDRQMACLERHRRDLRALTEILTQADAAIVRGAGKAVSELPPLQDCADHDALLAKAPPLDPGQAERVAEIEALLARGKHLWSLAQYDTALEVARDGLGAARALGHLPTQAQATLLLGRVQDQTVGPVEARQSMFEAVWLADRAGDDLLRADAWTRLVFMAGMRDHDYDEGELYVKHAQHALQRAGGDAGIEGELWNNAGILAWRRGDSQRSVDCHLKALELLRQRYEADNPRIGEHLINLAAALTEAGRLEEAEAALSEGHTLIQRAYGSKHPLAANALHNRALLAYMRKDFDAAVQLLEGAETIYAGSDPDHDGPELAVVRNDLGVVLIERGEHAKALTKFEQALRARKGHGSDEQNLVIANTMTGLGQALTGLGRTAEAAKILREALRIRETQHGSPQQIAESRFALAKALRTSDPAEATLQAHQALIAYQLGGNPAMARQVATWLGNPQ